MYLSESDTVASVDIVVNLNAEEVVQASVTFVKDRVVNQSVDILSTLKPFFTVNKNVALKAAQRSS